MHLFCSFPLCLFKSSHCEIPHWKQNFLRGSAGENLPTVAPVPRKGRPLKSGSRRRGMGTLNRRKIPDSCKPRIILPRRRTVDR